MSKLYRVEYPLPPKYTREIACVKTQLTQNEKGLFFKKIYFKNKMGGEFSTPYEQREKNRFPQSDKVILLPRPSFK